MVAAAVLLLLAGSAALLMRAVLCLWLLLDSKSLKGFAQVTACCMLVMLQCGTSALEA